MLWLPGDDARRFQISCRNESRKTYYHMKIIATVPANVELTRNQCVDYILYPIMQQGLGERDVEVHLCSKHWDDITAIGRIPPTVSSGRAYVMDRGEVFGLTIIKKPDLKDSQIINLETPHGN